ncbi:hypothetical protein [Yoonia sp. SS1-5]|uniref:TolB family protein n=1 Tax=Yoonia rhodophyticola TaxID=3137370 RepID=A0AAN0M9R0_9RHOB
MRSALCIYDLDQQAAEVLFATDAHIEAPNWHPDGYLIVNSAGRLYRVDMARPELTPIDTGFAQACNNDHGVSPDGQTLAISDRSRTDGSCIYTLPVSGGTPSRVTQQLPSYWHGWSPDGQRLAYVGRRDGPFALFTCQLDGTDETCLTDGFDHVDGPDYTPDGQWIWFNAERDGAVDLWRIRPDGTDLQQMTADSHVNWFPHPCPKGAHVLYLAYPQGTDGHPANRDVALCLMPADGGQTRQLLQICGGQGSINVPCWAPDGRRFAFMRFC